jgi:hypothetical protein
MGTNGTVVEYDKNFNEIWQLQNPIAMGRHPPQERQHADHRRRTTSSHAKSIPRAKPSGNLNRNTDLPADYQLHQHAANLHPIWPMATPLSARAATSPMAKDRNSSKSHRTGKFVWVLCKILIIFGSCNRRANFGRSGQSPKIPVNRNIDPVSPEILFCLHALVKKCARALAAAGTSIIFAAPTLTTSQ